MPNGAPHSVPPYHDALLQAAGLSAFRPLPPDRQVNSPCGIPAQCLPALEWALQHLCKQVGAEAAAPSSQPTVCCSSSDAGGASSSGGVNTSSSTADPAPAACSSKVGTVPGVGPAGLPVTSNRHSSGGIASFYSMRLLPHLPALLSELVALQPQSADVFDSVLTISTKCLSIGKKLQQAAHAQQSSQPGACAESVGLATLQGLYKACLKVFVPVQQHLAAPLVNTEAGTGVTKLYSGQASNLGVSLFHLLAGSMASFDQQHVEHWRALTAAISDHHRVLCAQHSAAQHNPVMSTYIP